MNSLINDFYIVTLFFKIILLVLIFYPLIRYSARKSKEFFNNKVGMHLGVLAGSCVYYGGLALLCIMILHTLGLNIGALLGAAGVFGIAIGFAAQTSISNMISGIFLLVERPFSINDEIECDGIKGIVEAIDPLSVKLRTHSNQLVRIPNEMLIKKSFINNTFYNIRRIQIPIKMRSNVELCSIMVEMLTLIKAQEGVLSTPEPNVFLSQITSITSTIMINCWVKKEDVSRVNKKLIQLFFEKYINNKECISIE